MTNYRNGNYSAFYVKEPVSESNLAANATKDFVFYNTLRMWKGGDTSFPFVDSHDKNYNVRDNSDWEMTLKPRLRGRIRNSKNIILFLSVRTKSSRALREEIDYGVNNQGLPIIVVYPDYSTKESLFNNGSLKQEIEDLWSNLPVFKNYMHKVPTLHIPMSKNVIKSALENKDFMLMKKITPDVYGYK